MDTNQDSQRRYVELPDGFVINVSGADAQQVLNNLTTNDVASLPAAHAFESFVTNLRGWVVAHGILARHDDQLRIVGQHADPEAICNHIDRYIIREDAEVRLDSKARIYSLLIPDYASWHQYALDSPSSAEFEQQRAASYSVGDVSLDTYRIADQLWLAACNAEQPVVAAWWQEHGVQAATLMDWEAARIACCWPRQGHEILEKTLPQELDRDERAISFTKGCYLGQETIARLDARGSIQKKLSLLEIDAEESPGVGAAITKDGNAVGELTSVVGIDNRFVGLAYIKRGSFDVGTSLQCGGASVTVIAPSD